MTYIKSKASCKHKRNLQRKSSNFKLNQIMNEICKKPNKSHKKPALKNCSHADGVFKRCVYVAVWDRFIGGLGSADLTVGLDGDKRCFPASMIL